MKKLLILILLFPFLANAQINGTLQKTSATNVIRGSFGSLGIDTLANVTGVLTNGYILKYNSTLKKWYAADGSIAGLQDSLTKKANRTFDNVASGAISQVKVSGLVSDIALKAPLVSPTFTGVPAAPTATAGTNTTQLATTAFVTAGINAISFAAFGSTPNANGASIASGVITLQPASASFPGGVTTGTQTFGGDKTLTGTLTGTDAAFTKAIINGQVGFNAVTAIAGSGGGQGIYATSVTGSGGFFETNGTSSPVVSAYALSTAPLFRGTNSGGTVFTIGNNGSITSSSLTNGLVKSTTGLLSNAVAGTDYLTPSGSGAGLTGVVLTTGAQTVAGVKSFTSNMDVSFGASTAAAIQATSTNAGGRALAALANSTLEPLVVTQNGTGKLAVFNKSATEHVVFRNDGSIYTKGQLEVSNLLVGAGTDSVVVHRAADLTIRRVGTTGTGSAVFSTSPTFASITNTGGYTQSGTTANTLTGTLAGTTLTMTGATNLATTSGNVGIGTTSPASKVTLEASDDVSLQFNATINSSYWRFKPSGGGFFLQYSNTSPTAGYSSRLIIDPSGNYTFSGAGIFGAPIRLKGYTVATLPAGTQGDSAFVTDALAPTFMSIIVGGGSVVSRVFYNGTNWTSQ